MARLTLDRLSMRFRTRRGGERHRAPGHQLRDQGPGVRGARRDVGLRQVEPSSAWWRACSRRATARPARRPRRVRARARARHGVPVLHAVSVAHRPAERGVRPPAARDAAGQARGGRRALHRLGRAGWLRERLPEGAVRRDDAAGCHRAGARERSRGAADGRALWRPRRPDPLPDGRAAPAGVGRGGEDGPVRDARHRGGPVPRRSGVRHDGPARAHPGGDPGPAAAAADRGHADVRGVRGTQAAGSWG